METKKNGSSLTERLASLDVLRGFDMLWIIGGSSLIHALSKTTEWGWMQALSDQMHHVEWEGFHFYDLIFPMFMFISGVAIPFAINSKVESGADKGLLFRKIVKRGIILVLFGLLYNGALERGFMNLRVASVLAQIGIGYMFAGLINLYTRSLTARAIWLIGILSGIAVLQLAVPVPGFGAGLLSPDGGINAWIDQKFLPGRLYGGTNDPEGLLCIVSAISVTLMGSLIGHILRDGNPANKRKATIIAVSGILLVIIALILSPYYPIIKKAWTVPFNLLTAGISSVLLSLFYFLIDVKKWIKGNVSKVWLFFTVIGMNSITIYLGTRIVNFNSISKFFTGWLASPFGDWVIALGAIAIEWTVLYFLYKKKIFLRV